MPAMFTHKRLASKANFCKTHNFKTNIGKQTTAAMEVDLWQQLPTELKHLSNKNKKKSIKNKNHKYLQTKQILDSIRQKNNCTNYYVLYTD